MKNRILRDPKMPMNLQFFAEDASASVADNTVADTDSRSETANNDTTDNSQKRSYEDAMAEIAAKDAQLKKMKADLDSALKKAGDATKQLRAKMSEAELKAEQDAQAKEEQDAYVKGLESYKAENEAFKRYTLQGMNSELAQKAAKAEIEGDMDALADIQKQHTQEIIKAKEAEWKASRPRVNMGDGDDSSMTKEEILAITDRSERQKAIAKHLDLFR